MAVELGICGAKEALLSSSGERRIERRLKIPTLDGVDRADGLDFRYIDLFGLGSNDGAFGLDS